MKRPSDKDIASLLDDIPYLWTAQGPVGQNRGRRALAELLWRWEFLPRDWWHKDESVQDEVLREMGTEVAVASVAIEAERLDYDHDLLLDKNW